MNAKAITITLSEPFMGELTWDLDGYLTNLRGADLKKAATDLGISFKSKTPVAEIRQAIRDHYVAVDTDYTEATPEPAESAVEVTRDPAAYRAHVKDQIHAAVASGDLAMPYGFNGRGMGAKHYLSVSPRTINRQIRQHQRKALAGLESPKLPDSERVQNYVRQNGTDKLTVNQYRRVRRNKADLYIMPGTTHPSDYLTGSFSRLATTPEGHSVFHQFAR